MNDTPAFPHVQLRDPTTQFTQTGMTLRDYFAGQALVGYLADGVISDPQYCAAFAYRVADAMIEARGE